MYLIIVLVLTMSFLLIPLLATNGSEISNAPSVNGTSLSSDKIHTDNAKLEELSQIKLYLTDEKTTLSIDKNEYILGVVAAEMSAENNIEALKAQALAAYTFAYRKHIQSSKANSEYDLTNDSTLDQSYIDEEGRKTKWGEKFTENENKIKQAIEAIDNQLIVYNGEPILAAYHAISAGKTETAKNVWGTDYPYLQSENSVCDLLSSNFYSEVSVGVDDFTKKITELGVQISGDTENIIGKCNKSPSGTVLNIELCGSKITGAKIREAFDLRSAAFDLVFKNNNFVFTVSGYGHGVGMSQFGANYMAMQGSDYKEIITTYYRGCEIVDIK